MWISRYDNDWIKTREIYGHTYNLENKKLKIAYFENNFIQL